MKYKSRPLPILRLMNNKKKNLHNIKKSSLDLIELYNQVEKTISYSIVTNRSKDFYIKITDFIVLKISFLKRKYSNKFNIIPSEITCNEFNNIYFSYYDTINIGFTNRNGLYLIEKSKDFIFLILLNPKYLRNVRHNNDAKFFLKSLISYFDPVLRSKYPDLNRSLLPGDFIHIGKKIFQFDNKSVVH